MIDDAGPRHGTDTSLYLRGALLALIAVGIWAGWIVVTRLGVTTTLTAFDITALRIGVAGTLLLPVALRRGVALDRLGWGGLILLVLGGGAPIVLLVGVGLMFAPAAHAGALFPGVMPMFTALLATVFLEETFPPAKAAGLVLILCGVLAIVGITVLTVTSASVGHLCFLGAGLLWACYTVVLRRARLDGLHAVAIISVISMAVYLPIYMLFVNSGLPLAPWRAIVFQGLYQGVLTMIVSLVLYGRAVSLLGASGAAAFGALGPALAALFAIPILGEYPAPTDWGAILLIASGVYLMSGGPLPHHVPGK